METPYKIRIALAEDHQLLRKTIVTVLNDEPDFEVIIAATNGAELLNKLETVDVDIILLDLNMPVMDGRDTLPVILNKYKNSKVIVLSMYYGEPYVEKYMGIGAHGYLSKDCAPDYLKEAIRDVYFDGIFLHEQTSAQTLQSLIEREVYIPVEPDYPLSEMENDVVLLICDQKSDIEISESIDRSMEETEQIKQSIMQKLKARNRAGVLGYALKNDLYKLMI